MDAYRIGVSIALANGVSPVLAIIGRDLTHLHTSVQQIQQNFSGWGRAIAGVGSIMAGSGILSMVTHLAEKAADFQDAMTKVSQLNPKVAALVNSGEMNKLAFRLGKQIGMKVEDITNIYGGIYSVLQDPEEAEKITPFAARYARLMQMRHPGSHPEGSINTAMRAGELSGRLTDDKGQIDPTKVKAWFDMLARLDAGTHGQFNPETALGLAQQGGGVSLRGLSERGYEHMAIVAQMMGGQRAGTALMSLRAQLGGNMMKRVGVAMQHFGLLGAGEMTSEGGHAQLTEAASRRLTKLVSNDPMDFVNFIVDRLEAKGITDKDRQMDALGRILGRQTTMRMISDMLLARQQIARETTGLEQGMPVDQALAGYDRNIHAQQQALGAAWHNLQVAVAGPASENFALWMHSMTGIINQMSDAVQGIDPETMATIFKGLTYFAVGLIGIGSVMLVSLMGLPAIAAAALGAAVVTAFTMRGDGITPATINRWINRFLVQPIQDFFTSDHAVGMSTSWFSGFNFFQKIFGPIIEDFNRELALFGHDLERLWGWIKWLFDKASSLAMGWALKPDAPGTKPSPNVDDFGRIIPNVFHPSSKEATTQQASFSLHVDGRALAQTVIDHLESIYGMPMSGASADGMHSPFADQWSA